MSQAASAETHSEQAAVLIIADDADLTRTITSRWQAERSVPAFTLMSGDLCPGINANAFELAIVGSVRPGALRSVLTILEPTAKPAIFLTSSSRLAATVHQSPTRTPVSHPTE